MSMSTRWRQTQEIPAFLPPPPKRPGDGGPEKNSRLTAQTAVVLLVLLFIEGVTVLRIHQLLSVHVLVGMILVPPVVLKMSSTLYRFGRYYLGSPAYRRKGPPPPLLRLLGPVVVLTTLVLFASGIALLLVNGTNLQSQLLLLHKASFVVWFGAMALHVLGHVLDTARVAPRDWMRRTQADVSGARARQWLVASSVAVGVPLGALLMGRAGTWFATYSHVVH
jgi:hypothetical protein